MTNHTRAKKITDRTPPHNMVKKLANKFEMFVFHHNNFRANYLDYAETTAN